MAAGFQARGWDLDIATTPVTPGRESADWNGARIHEFAISGDQHPKHHYTGDIASYRKFISEGNWDIIIFHAYLWSLYVPLDLLDKIPAKKILVSHGFPALQWVRHPTFPWGLWVWAWWIFRSLEMTTWLGKIDRTVYLSNLADFRGFFDHRIAKALGYPGSRVIPNGVNLQERGRDADGFRDEVGIRKDQIMFLCVANYSRRKDQGFAARAFRAAAVPDAVLVFIGSEFNGDSARFRKEDEESAGSGNAGQIVWLEKVDRSRTLDAFAACDVAVLSADHEGQPIALLEAMREAKPWVARDAGCISELPGGCCVRTESTMTAQMVQLATDTELRKRLGEEGRAAIVSTYNHQRYIDSYCDLVVETTAAAGLGQPDEP